MEDSTYAVMDEYIHVYNADDPSKCRNILSSMQFGMGADYFCGNTTNGNVARFTIQPGTTSTGKRTTPAIPSNGRAPSGIPIVWMAPIATRLGSVTLEKTNQSASTNNPQTQNNQ